MKKLRVIFSILVLVFTVSKASAQLIYPGDANSDSIVNHLDLLFVGKNFSYTGSPRASVSNSFTPQIAPAPWSYSYFGVNAMFSDCNGDGVVNDLDTVAIHLNYNLSCGHIPGQYFNEINNDLNIITNKDTITFGDTLTFKFSNNGQDEYALGMAYSLEYNSQFSDLISSFSYNTNNVWFNSLTDNFTIAKQNTTKESFEMAVVRKDGFDPLGNGDFGELSIIIEEDLLGGSALNNGFLNFQLKNVIQMNGIEIDTLGSNTHSVYFQNNEVSIKRLADWSAFQIYNNNEYVSIENIQQNKNLNFEIIDVLGKRVLSGNVNESIELVDITNIKQGLYFLIIQQGDNSFIKKIVKK